MSLGYADYGAAHSETKSYEYFTGLHQTPTANQIDEEEPIGSPVLSPVASPVGSPVIARRQPPKQLGSPGFAAVAARLNPHEPLILQSNSNSKNIDPAAKTLKDLQTKQMAFVSLLEKRQRVTLAYLQKKQQQENDKIMSGFAKIMETNQNNMQDMMSKIVSQLAEQKDQNVNLNDYFAPPPAITTRSDINRELEPETEIRKYYGLTLDPPMTEKLYEELNCDPELDELFKNPVVPRDGAMEYLKYSDENPLARPFVNANTQLIAERVWVSDLQKNTSTDPPENFTAELNIGGYRNISEIYPLVIDIRWTPTATYTRNVFVRFPDFDHFQTTTNGFQYHNYVPLVQGSAGTPLTFTYRLDDDYSTDFRKFNRLNNKLRVQLFKEDSTTGLISPFVELDAVAIELRIKCIDQDIHTVPIKDYSKREIKGDEEEVIIDRSGDHDGVIPILL